MVAIWKPLLATLTLEFLREASQHIGQGSIIQVMVSNPIPQSACVKISAGSQVQHMHWVVKARAQVPALHRPPRRQRVVGRVVDVVGMAWENGSKVVALVLKKKLHPFS